MGKFRAICKGCYRVFGLEKSDDEYCYTCDQNRKDQASCIPNMICKHCCERFYSPNHKEICHYCSACDYSKATRKQKTFVPNLEKKKKGKGLPLQELIRRQEYKRVMDDSGWDHYLKGRKWDRI